MTPRIFHSDLTDRWYYAGRVKDRGNGTFEVIGNKLDVTDEIRAIIAKATANAEARIVQLTDRINSAVHAFEMKEADADEILKWLKIDRDRERSEKS